MDQEQNQQSTPKQQVVERIRQANNVLVTVKSNPNVDELAAAIGLTLMLNKLGKHATAVFSGEVPSTLEFLKPEETIETNTDSLRDFIVSLDKSKADKLRYKVEENVVKIFITPYRTSITENDLEFTQGDFNVDVVVALGVTQREELDQAIVAHGRILHDATVVTITAGQDYSELGQINWQEAGASSLSEMLVSISEAFQGGLIDTQIATAFLTGIVAETQRFSNPKTTPKVMTMAAQLMAAGANQQLIANELERAVEVNVQEPQEEQQSEEKPAEAVASDDGSLTISHAEEAKANEPIAEEKPEPPSIEPLPEVKSEFKAPSEQTTSSVLPPPMSPTEMESFDPLMDTTPEETQPAVPAAAPSEQQAPEQPTEPVLPTLVVKEEPPEDSNQIHIDNEGNLMRRVAVEPKHKIIEPLPAPDSNSLAPLPDLGLGDNDSPLPSSSLPPVPELDLTPSEPIKDDTTLLEIEEAVHSPHLTTEQPSTATDGIESARDAVSSALNQGDFDPAHQSRDDIGSLPLEAPPAPTTFDSFRLPDAPPAPSAPAIDMNSAPNTLPLPSNNQDDALPPPPPVPPPMMPQ